MTAHDAVVDRKLSTSSSSGVSIVVVDAAASEAPKAAGPGTRSQPTPAQPPRGHAWLRQYFTKWRGGRDTRLDIPPNSSLAWGFVGAFFGILAISGVSEGLTHSQPGGVWLCASFGASAVLVYGVPDSKFSSPRCLVGGQFLSGLVGVLTRLAFQGHVTWLANAVSTGLALTVMQLTRTTHPPAGGTAAIATSLPGVLPWAGFSFLVAVCVDALVVLLVGLVINNLSRQRSYPTYWW